MTQIIGDLVLSSSSLNQPHMLWSFLCLVSEGQRLYVVHFVDIGGDVDHPC
jgi:hypothetical protein